jgi:hypothetical protein
MSSGMGRASSGMGRASSEMGRAFSGMGRASLEVITGPSSVRSVTPGTSKGALGTSTASQRARTGALDVRRASVVTGSGVFTKTSGCSRRSDRSGRSSSGSSRSNERRRRHSKGRSRCGDRLSRSSWSCRPSLFRRYRSSGSVPPRGDGRSMHSDGGSDPFVGASSLSRPRLCEFRATLSKKQGHLYGENGTPCSNLGTLS